MDEHEIRLMISDMKNELLKEVKDVLKEGIAEFKNYITDMNEQRFKTIDETLKRFQSHHNDHYTSEKLLDKSITDSRIAITKEVDEKIKNLDDKVDNLPDKISGKSRDNVSKIIAGVSVIVAIIAIVIASWPK